LVPALWLGSEAKRVIEPVKNAGVRESISAALAVRTCTLRGCEADHGLRAGEVLKKHVRLALQVHILFGIEDQRRAGDLLRDPALIDLQRPLAIPPDLSFIVALITFFTALIPSCADNVPDAQVVPLQSKPPEKRELTSRPLRLTWSDCVSASAGTNNEKVCVVAKAAELALIVMVLETPEDSVLGTTLKYFPVKAGCGAD